jgi:hypothetical protein
MAPERTPFYTPVKSKGGTIMNITVNWPRFLAVSVVGAIIMLVLYSLFPMIVGSGMSEGYPARPEAEMKPLLPFLFAVSLIQLVVFCYMYMRVYPKRSVANAAWWGVWGGFFMVIPDGQFFVGTPNETWAQLFQGWAEGIVVAVLMTVFFQLVYRPKDESWGAVRVEWPRFLVFGVLSAILVFALDLPFHQFVAPKIFSEYPAHDYPHRPVEDAKALMPFLFATYLYQLGTFCYLFLRMYPRRGMGSAIWFGTWLGVWVVIPNMQFFVGLDKYTWNMLIIQVPEGTILTIIMMVFFELAYRPKARVASLAPAE